MDPVFAVAAAPGTLTLGGVPYLVLPPTPGDKARTVERMRELARARCLSPVDYALTHAHLAPAALALVVSEAIKLGAGGGVEPTAEAVWEQFDTLDGVRWRVWYHLSKTTPAATPEAVAALVTEANRGDVAAALDAALKLEQIDPKGLAPATGSA